MGSSQPRGSDTRDGLSVLDRLVSEARAETAARRERVSAAEVESLARRAPPSRDFAAALRAPGLAVIAEMKAASPSAGRLVTTYDPHRLARDYARGGAAALSVLCQATSFGGHPEHLLLARRACRLPILRKDFVVEPYQVYEGRAFGADAVLLIVAALAEDRLRELVELVERLRMTALVEVHDAAELDVALAAGARVVGVNHRDLRTLAVDLGLTERLRPAIPPDVVVVAESGISNREAAARMRAAGADAVLVGEALLRAADPADLIGELAVP